eukprot:TRINITY_DN524_c0_g1_i3.p1 TRINITY_DN524_c0_g1~~TRINITY_DN524_c0_g1_i3.p1  ORF type:complete len:809 (-),score=211.28 TRINITY_DN524_c0_g1_i3:419-2845(-)
MGRQAWKWALFCLVAFLAVQVSISDEVNEGQTEEDVPQPEKPEHQFRKGSQKFEFQAEVSRLLDIIINSLYSNKDIFLRELISNASDALDKLRFLALTDKSMMGEGDDAELEIRISIDKDKKLLKIRDRGIGMTKNDLINNLGTIAKSGTSAFLENIQKAGDMNLIGQFGVGFYSVYLVADYVEVVSKHNDDKQYVWESQADGNFAVSEDTEGEPIGRGTQINIFLKEECMEYLEEHKVKDLVHKYSEFIDFPIYMLTTKEVPVEEDEEEEEDDEDADDEVEEGVDGEIEDEDYEDDLEDDTPTPPKEPKFETVTDWELLNDNKAIWLRDSKEITEEDYQNFYKALTKNTYEEALSYAHFKAEGDVEFKAILYVPSRAPYNYYDNYYSKQGSLKLYVRRVFISDEFEDLLPRYLSFLAGLVDSDSLPLNVSREMLQQLEALKTIKKKLVRKALDMIKKMAEAELKARKKAAKDEKDKAEDEEEEEEEEETEIDEEEAKKYTTFWNEFGKAMKLGIIEDSQNRNRIAKLIRFQTSLSKIELTSLDEYIERMKEGQKNIYYVAGQSYDEVANSPFVENLLVKGYEVIYFTDPVDEYMMQHMFEYEDYHFMNAAKDELKLTDKDDKEKKAEKQLKKQFEGLTKWWKGIIGDESIENVKVSRRLATTPCIVVTSKFGWSANMQRIMEAQALTDSQKQAYMKGRKILEINPRHPLIKELKLKVDADEESSQAKDMALMLYETALLESGFSLDNSKDFSQRVYALIKDQIGMKASLDDIEELVEGDDEEEEEDEEEVEEANVLSDVEPELHLEL